MSDLRKPAQEETDGNEQQRIRSGTIEDDNPLALETILPIDVTASTSDVVQDAGMEDFYVDIFDVLSNVELPSTLPEQAIVTSSINVPSVSKQQFLEQGESSGVKKTKAAIEKSNSDDENQRRDSKRSRRDDQPPRSRSAQLHNMSERIQRDRIRRKMKALQDLIPNCNTRDNASMLDDAIMYIKALQNQILMMSTGAGAMLQNPYALQAGYQGLQLPQFSSQFMPMRPGIGMGMYGMSSSTALHVMPFPLASPCQSTLAASGMVMVGPMPRMQLPLNPFQLLPSADSGSTLMAAQTSCTSLASTLVCSTQAETSSLSAPRAAQAPLMNQGPSISGSSGIVLPSQIITPASSSSTSLEEEVPLHPKGTQ